MSTRGANLMPSRSAMTIAARQAADDLAVPAFDPIGPRASAGVAQRGPALPALLVRASPEQPRGFTGRQTILSVVVEVDPKKTAMLRAVLEKLRNDEEATQPKYERLKRAVPALHFISMTVFEDAHHDPMLVTEVNFDGPPGPFWASLEAAIGPRLRDMVRCCKRPRDGTAAMFDAIVPDGARLPVAPFLEAWTVRPAAGHQGNRGLTRARIEAEAALFQAAQEELEDRKRFAGMSAAEIHATLRRALLPDFGWLDTESPRRIAWTDNASDWLRLVGFAAAALLAVSAPAILAWLLLPWWLVPLLSLAVSFAFALVLRGRGGPETPSGLLPRSPWVRGALALLLFSGVLPVVLGILCWLRWLEERDQPQDAPPVDEEEVRRMSAREDRVLQNHMGSVVLVKPGALRAALIRGGLWGLGLLLRVLPDARRGYLASMRTIHFAHWALVSNGGRLMFFSNFDGTWESYLDDFIEKAHGGLTLAWCNCVGFPPARFLWLEGATHGRRFKAWARSSMAVSGFWFSAYPDLTVEQIERQYTIAEGLRRRSLSPEEAAEWACLL